MVGLKLFLENNRRSYSETAKKNLGLTKTENSIPKYYVKIFDGTKKHKNLLLDDQKIQKSLLKNEYEILLKRKEAVIYFLNKVNILWMRVGA